MFLAVDHLNYDRPFGDEPDDALQCLCILCHARKHHGRPICCGPFTAIYDPSKATGPAQEINPEDAEDLTISIIAEIHVARLEAKMIDAYEPYDDILSLQEALVACRARCRLLSRENNGILFENA